MVVIAMTSWKMRIKNVEHVVRNVLDSTVVPDRIYLTLSSDEFKNKEKDLPSSLVELFNSDDRLIINWVKENTKTMKKVFPILQYLDDNDLIINIDDDIIIPREAIEYRINEFNGEPITGANNPRCHMIDKFLGLYSFGPFSIFQKKHLKNWEKFVNDEIIKTYNDDYTYSVICWLNGYHVRPCTDYSRHTGISKHKIEKFNDVCPSYNMKLYLDRMNMYKVLRKRATEVFGSNSFLSLFGVWKEK